MKRVIEREWLDDLPADDPGAIGSRRDIRRLNRLMGHAGILRRLLASRFADKPPLRIVELGAGDGTFLLELAKSFPRQTEPVEATLVDCKDTMSVGTRDEFKSLNWRVEIVTADVFDWLNTHREPPDVIIANLFLHHFTADQLTEMLRLAAAQTVLFVATEPRRAALPLALSRLIGLIGCNPVTRHDAVASVRAGFAGEELSALWPDQKSWQLHETGAGWCTHTFLAQRMDQPSRAQA